MNKADTARMLMAASGYSDYVVADEVTTTAWQFALKDVSFDDAMTAVYVHFTGPNAAKKFMVHYLLEIIGGAGRNNPADIETDVRVAKTRGLIAKSWPERDSLPAEVQERLFNIREADRREVPDYVELSSQAPAWVGRVGRSTP
jgi:hypothetical protein